METLKQIVKGNAVLDSIRGGGVASYIITSENNKKYLLDIDLSNKKDVGDGVFKREEKAIYLMRWIRKAMEKGEPYVYLPGKNGSSDEFTWSATYDTIARLREDGFDIDKVWDPWEYWSVEWGY